MIKPTVGRVVWYYPNGGAEDVPPMAAIVACVHSDTLVTLAYFHASGMADRAQGVTLVQEGEPLPNYAYCCWMPYQIGQAKKYEPAVPPTSEPAARPSPFIEQGTI